MAQQQLAFLFDLDGVLIDSENEYTRIWQVVEEEYPTGIENFAIRIKGTTLENILSTYYPDPETRAKVEARLYELEGKMHYDYTPGARCLLDSLRVLHIPAVMVTSSNDVKLRHLWEQHPEMLNDFVKIIDGDMVTRSKPDPEGYLLGAEAAKTLPAHCVVVEDSLQGVKAGHAAGAYVIGVAGTLPADTLRPWCDEVVTSLTEIDVDKLKQRLS